MHGLPFSESRNAWLAISRVEECMTCHFSSRNSRNPDTRISGNPGPPDTRISGNPGLRYQDFQKKGTGKAQERPCRST